MQRSSSGGGRPPRTRPTAHELARYEALFASRTRAMKSSAMREMMALTVYADASSLCLAALVVLVHPLGYVVAAALAWLRVRVSSRAGVRPGGLRITRG